MKQSLSCSQQSAGEGADDLAGRSASEDRCGCVGQLVRASWFGLARVAQDGSALWRVRLGRLAHTTRGRKHLVSSSSVLMHDPVATRCWCSLVGPSQLLI